MYQVEPLTEAPVQSCWLVAIIVCFIFFPIERIQRESETREHSGLILKSHGGDFS